MGAAKNNMCAVGKKTMDAVKASISFCIVSILLSGCAASLSSRDNLAADIAEDGAFVKAVYHAAPFYITSFAEKNIHAYVGRMYIEGDGLAWLSKTQPSLNPTPIDPYALRLAEADDGAGVDRVYLARPCQYSGWDKASEPCPRKYWTTHRYADDVVAAYRDLVDRIKALRGWQAIEFVGYSGGATLALLIADGRDDVVAIRTVAGNLDIDAHSRHHNVDLMPYSQNPARRAAALAHYPQIHFIGGEDKIVPRNIAQSYAHQAGDSRCITLAEIGGVTHGKGWVEKWPSLLRRPISCKSHY